jgi:hypothetical protein
MLTSKELDEIRIRSILEKVTQDEVVRQYDASTIVLRVREKAARERVYAAPEVQSGSIPNQVLMKLRAVVERLMTHRSLSGRGDETETQLV